MSLIAARGGRRALIALVGALAATCMLAAQAHAALPSISVEVTKTGATLTGTPESGAINVITKAAPGVKEASVILFQLKPGATLAEVEAFAANKKAQSDPNNASKYGSIVFDAEAPGETQVSLASGNYVLLTSEGEKPVAVRSSFAVAESKAPAALPAPAAVVRSIEFAFKGPSTLHDGELVEFENEGFLVHMDFAVPVKSMKAAEKVVKALKSGNEKAFGRLIAGAPVSFAGPLSHEAAQEETISAKPGIYVQLCFMTTQDGRSHTLLGMERIIKITK
jgi:hypothetical protein